MPALVAETVNSIRKMFGNYLEPKVAEGVNLATSAADPTVRRWGAKVSAMWTYHSSSCLYCVTSVVIMRKKATELFLDFFGVLFYLFSAQSGRFM